MAKSTAKVICEGCAAGLKLIPATDSMKAHHVEEDGTMAARQVGGKLRGMICYEAGESY